MRLKIPVNVGATVLGFLAAMTKINPYFRSPAPLKGCRKICHTVISTTLRGLPGQLCSGCETHTAPPPSALPAGLKGLINTPVPLPPVFLSFSRAFMPAVLRLHLLGSPVTSLTANPGLLSHHLPWCQPQPLPQLVHPWLNHFCCSWPAAPLPCCCYSSTPLLLLLTGLSSNATDPLQPVTLFDLGLGLQEADTRW